MISPQWARPDTTRSVLMLEIASVLVADKGQPYRQAMIHLREQGAAEWPLSLFASGGLEGIEAVVRREAAIAIVNPVTALALAYRGNGPFRDPQPVRAIGVIPSPDQFLFVVRPETGLKTFEEIATRRYPLRVSLRGEEKHGVHCMLDDIVAAAGFTLRDLQSWGGEVRRDAGMPFPHSSRFQALSRGEIDSIIDEGARSWGEESVDAGFTLLPLAESTVEKLEALGYRRSVLRKGWGGLADDLLTIDFSGWAIFVHAELADDLVTKMCAALDARKHMIPWQGDGPLPVERMCLEAPDTPQDVPLHPAAARYWREVGYLKEG